MIGRGRVISLSPSGAHLGAGQELSDLPHHRPFQKVQRTAAILAQNRGIPLDFLYRETLHCQSRKANQDES